MCDPAKLAQEAAAWYAGYSEPYLAEPVKPELDVRAWFADTVVPLIERGLPELAAEMSIVVEGSFAYGYYDQYSDLDSIVVLPDNTPAEQATALEALLAPLRFSPDYAHQEVGVRAFCHLLDGCANDFMRTGSPPPWETVAVKTLHNVTTALIVHDARGRFAALRAAAAPTKFPDRLWRKLLIWNLRRVGPFPTPSIPRGLTVEVREYLTRAVRSALQVCCILNRSYYPYFKRLRHALEPLPLLTHEVLPHIDRLSAFESDWRQKQCAVWSVRRIYETFIREHGILTDGDLMDLDRTLEQDGWRDPGWPNACWSPRPWPDRQGSAT